MIFWDIPSQACSKLFPRNFSGIFDVFHIMGFYIYCHWENVFWGKLYVFQIIIIAKKFNKVKWKIFSNLKVKILNLKVEYLNWYVVDVKKIVDEETLLWDKWEQVIFCSNILRIVKIFCLLNDDYRN